MVLLAGAAHKTPLAARVFDEKTKKVAYAKQTQAVKGKNKSNCPLCAVGDNANKARIYDFDEMDADHVAAWSKGGDSLARTCPGAVAQSLPVQFPAFLSTNFAKVPVDV